MKQRVMEGARSSSSEPVLEKNKTPSQDISDLSIDEKNRNQESTEINTAESQHTMETRKKRRTSNGVASMMNQKKGGKAKAKRIKGPKKELEIIQKGTTETEETVAEVTLTENAEDTTACLKVESEDITANQHNDNISRDTSELDAVAGIYVAVKELKCSQCKGCFTDQTEFDKHTCQGKTYICGACHCGFTRLCYLKRHKCANAGEKSKNSNKQSLVENLFSMDNGEKQNEDSNAKRRKSGLGTDDGKCLQCPMCPKKYSKQVYLDKHMFVHNDIAPWSCPECDEKFRSAAKFQAHCKSHGIQKPFKCEKCDAYFASMVVLRVHDRTHTNERPFSCSQCGKMFKQSSNLYDHLRKHNNDRPFICGTCGKAFNLKGDLTKHLQLHTGEKPYHCTYCPMSFPRISNLNRHLNTHTGTKPFSCSHCEKSFSRREKLRDHERIHSGERPYVCDICQKSFADSGNFSNHKKFHRNPELKHPSRKKSSTTRNRSLTGNIHQMNPLFPVINVDENRSLLSINVDSVPQLPAQERVTEFNSGQQQQIMFVTFPSSAVIAEKPNDGEKTCEGTRTEPLILQLHSLTDGHDQVSLAGNSSNNNENTELSDERFGSSEIPDNVDRAVRDGAVSTSGFQPTSPGNFVDSSIQMTGSLQQILSAVSESQQILEQSNPAAGFIMPGYSSDLQEQIDSEEKEHGTINQGTSNVEYRYFNLAPSSENYFTSSLTLTDLTGSDYYNSMCDGQPGYVFIPQEGSDIESSKVNGILFATPTKTNSHGSCKSKSALICSQVLVTPEHDGVAKNSDRVSEGSDEERTRFKPRALKL